MKRNNTGKRLTAGLLSCAMALSLCAPALAEGTAALPAAQSDVSLFSEEGDIPLTEEYFPDAIFRDCLKQFNRGGDSFTKAQREAVTEINVDRRKISDLTGLEYFPNLTVLFCDETQLTSLDVSKNTKLSTLTCNETPLTSLDLSQNTALKVLACQKNALQELDVSKNLNLSELYCSGNQLTSLDLSQNKALRYLNCSNNQLASLDLSQNPDLFQLNCSNNQLTSLDVSNKPGLESLWCNRNQLTSLNVNGSTALTALDCSNNQLTGIDLSQNSNLRGLWCSSNQLASLNLHPNAAQERLEYADNSCKITLDRQNQFDLSQLDGFDPARAVWPDNVTVENGILTVPNGETSASYQYDIWNNKNPDTYLTFTLTFEKDPSYIPLTADYFPDAAFRTCLSQFDEDKDNYLSLSEREAVTEINVRGKKISDLTGIEYFPNLTKLDCGSNNLTSLDVSKNTNLTELYCYDNQLTRLDVSQNTKLTNLRCDYNSLISLDVGQNTALTRLECTRNQLTSLDVSQNTALIYLDCIANRLTSLDLSHNPNLTWLQCDRNNLTGIDLRQNPNLTVLACSYNQLTSLDVSKNTNLTELYCYDNQLTSLDLSGIPNLLYLNCYYNSRQITLDRLGRFDLSQLDGFDPARAVWSEGVTEKNGVLTVPFGETSVTYQYDVRGNKNPGDYTTFTLTFDPVSESEQHIWNVADGLIRVYLDDSGTQMVEQGNHPAIADPDPIITGTADTAAEVILEGTADQPAKATLRGLNGSAYIFVQSGSAELTLDGENSLTGKSALLNGTLDTKLTFKGDGRLNLTLDNANANDSAICADSLIFEGGTVEVKAAGERGHAVDVNNLTMEGGSLSVETDGEKYDAVYAAKKVTVNSGSLYAKTTGNGANAIESAGEAAVNGGSLSAETTGDNATAVLTGDSVAVSGGTLSAATTGRGAYAVNTSSLTVTGGGLNAAAPGDESIGIFVPETITISGGSVTTEGGLIGLSNPKNVRITGGQLRTNGLACRDTVIVSGDAQVTISPVTVDQNGHEPEKLWFIAQDANKNDVESAPDITGLTSAGWVRYLDMDGETVKEIQGTDIPIIDPDDTAGDGGSALGAVIAGAAIGGTAVWLGYEIVTDVILGDLLPAGAAVPKTRAQLAVLMWNNAGRPEPATAPAFADVADSDTAKAAQWCTEQGLLDARGDRFDPDGWTPKFKTIEVWNRAFPKG